MKSPYILVMDAKYCNLPSGEYRVRMSFEDDAQEVTSFWSNEFGLFNKSSKLIETEFMLFPVTATVVLSSISL